MFVNTQMLTKKQLAMMQALFAYFACENFRDDPTAEKFVKILDETRDYLHAIPGLQGKGGFKCLKKTFDNFARVAISDHDLKWKDFPITGLHASLAMGCVDFLPDIELRLFLKRKCDQMDHDHFALSLVAFAEFIKEAIAWFEENGQTIDWDGGIQIISIKDSGESDDN